MSGRLCAALALALTLLCSCAVTVEENRRALNALDASSLAPSSTSGRWALSPIALPAGIVTLVVDAVLVHPTTVWDDAWGDTIELLWTPRDESRFRRALMLPLVTLATPLVYIGDGLGRAIFAIPPRDDTDEGER